MTFTSTGLGQGLQHTAVMFGALSSCARRSALLSFVHSSSDRDPTFRVAIRPLLDVGRRVDGGSGARVALRAARSGRARGSLGRATDTAL